jgi:hypothetical protein
MAPLNELGPGQPNVVARPILELLTNEALFPASGRIDADLAAACRAALWLRHDFLDESHKISQEIATPEGSFWHGIMHRREPDPDNSKYWFRRVVYVPLRQAAAELATTNPASRAVEFLAIQPMWDPYRWIDLCEAARSGQAKTDVVALCQRIQRCEWELLFDYCHRQATGARP